MQGDNGCGLFAGAGGNAADLHGAGNFAANLYAGGYRIHNSPLAVYVKHIRKRYRRAGQRGDLAPLHRYKRLRKTLQTGKQKDRQRGNPADTVPQSLRVKLKQRKQNKHQQ